jgi:hypothetical protein
MILTVAVSFFGFLFANAAAQTGKPATLSKDYGFKRWRPDHGTTLDKYEKELTRWEKLLRDISRK